MIGQVALSGWANHQVNPATSRDNQWGQLELTIQYGQMRLRNTISEAVWAEASRKLNAGGRILLFDNLSGAGACLRRKPLRH